MWNYLVGKKSYIGIGLTAIGVVGSYFGMSEVGTVVATVGGLIGVTGVIHKGSRVLSAIQGLLMAVNEVIEEAKKVE